MCGAAAGDALYAVAVLLNLIKRKVIGIEAKWIDDTRPYILRGAYVCGCLMYMDFQCHCEWDFGTTAATAAASVFVADKQHCRSQSIK